MADQHDPGNYDRKNNGDEEKRDQMLERNEVNFMSGPLGSEFKMLANSVVFQTRPGRDQSIAITLLEDALFRAHAAMHRG